MSIESLSHEILDTSKNNLNDIKGFDPDKRIDVNGGNSVDKPTAGFDPDKRVEKTPCQGGSYKDVKNNNDSEGKEVHHIPADCATKLERNDGPAILMDAKDHKLTASCGSSKEARAYQAKQKELIENGKFKEAFEMDVKDLQSKFGDKYDTAIAEARAYVDKLEQEGKI
ncbi:hypothetical protein [Ruminococcus flavefaciens]|uniref:hypothetical protein n=1 Tax=Ruminococcus flavefaciens TaxID=1265 RepID=UPI0026ED498E|nr:hypothetical protein [Ruminococcus flavefaciens]